MVAWPGADVSGVVGWIAGGKFIGMAVDLAISEARTADETAIDTSGSAMGWTLSPHEECAVEEAVQITERLGGTVSVIGV